MHACFATFSFQHESGQSPQGFIAMKKLLVLRQAPVCCLFLMTVINKRVACKAVQLWMNYLSEKFVSQLALKTWVTLSFLAHN